MVYYQYDVPEGGVSDAVFSGSIFSWELGSVEFGGFPGSPSISKAVPFVIQRENTDI